MSSRSFTILFVLKWVWIAANSNCSVMRQPKRLLSFVSKNGEITKTAFVPISTLSIQQPGNILSSTYYGVNRALQVRTIIIFLCFDGSIILGKCYDQLEMCSDLVRTLLISSFKCLKTKFHSFLHPIENGLFRSFCSVLRHAAMIQ